MLKLEAGYCGENKAAS